MIEDIGKYYLYRHIRLDTNQPFYIGIGTKQENKYKNSFEKTYHRAVSKKNRNDFWKNVVNKTGYKVQILMESDNYKFLENKEKEFIKLYGRVDIKTGLLVNFTEGGSGVLSISDETKDKIRNKLLGHKDSDEIREKKSRLNVKFWLGKVGKDFFMSKEVLQFDLQGNFIQEFENAVDVKRKLGFDTANIYRCCQGKRKTCKKYVWKFK